LRVSLDIERECHCCFHQRLVDIIIPRGIENKVAIEMVVQRIRQTLNDKSRRHREELQRLGKQVEDVPLSPKVLILPQRPQVSAMNTIIQDPSIDGVGFVFYFDRIATVLIEKHVPLPPKHTHTSWPKRPSS
jgi:uridine kinase